MNSLFSWLISSDFVKAQILAFVRHGVTALGAGLVANGYASDSMVQAASGLVCMAVSFYLSQRDVVGVDKKITVALNTPSPTQTEEQEREETRELNKQYGIGK